MKHIEILSSKIKQPNVLELEVFCLDKVTRTLMYNTELKSFEVYKKTKQCENSSPRYYDDKKPLPRRIFGNKIHTIVMDEYSTLKTRVSGCL